MTDTTVTTETPSIDAPVAETPESNVADNERLLAKMAARTQRSVFRPNSPSPAAPLPLVSDDAAFEALTPGRRFKDAEGQKFLKPHVVSNDADYASVPEGAEFVDKEGGRFKKPFSEPLNFTAQTLYQMSPDSATRRKALEKIYPGQVKQDAEGLYIDEGEGRIRRPGGERGVRAFFGNLAAETAPTGGSIIGGLAGGAVANAPGALGGAFLGGGLGQGFNDLVLGLSGIHTPSVGEEALRMGTAGLVGMAGEGAGRVIGAAVPTMREGISHLTELGPKALRKSLIGTSGREELEFAEKLTTQGFPALPSTVLKGAPRLQNAVERFRERYSLGAARKELEPYYEKEANVILDKLGIKTEPQEKLLHPTKAIDVEQAGKALQDRAIQDLAKADATLDAEIAVKKATAQAGALAKQETKTELLRSAEQTRVEAQKVVDQGFANIRKDIDEAFKLTKAGHNGGDLFGMVSDKFRALRVGFGERANYWYTRFDEMTGGATVSSEQLSSTAQKMLAELPAPFKINNPALVQKLAKLAPQYDAEGQLVKAAEPIAYGELQKLRSLFRGAADWETLSGDFKNGQLKFFSNEINRLLHAPEAPKEAVKFLDMVDKWYGTNIKIYDSEMIKALQKGLASGEPADPKVVRDILLKDGHSDLIKKTFDMMGPTLAGAVRAADLNSMLQNAKSYIPGAIDGTRFFNEVMSRYRSGLLEAAHGPETTKMLLKQAEYLQMLEGKLPVRVEQGDRIADVIAKSRAAKNAADDQAKKDPMKALTGEMKAIDAERKKRLQERVQTEQLGFLYDPTYGAIKASEKILGNPDLIIASADKFTPTSPEFNMLRQIYVKRLLEGGSLVKEIEHIPDSIQRLMFQSTYADMQLLAKEWKTITSAQAFHGDTASGMMTQSRAENPLGRILSGPAKLLPGAKMSANAAWSSYYEFITDWVAKNPALYTYMLRGLRGTPIEKEAVRDILSKHAQKYGAVGAGTAEAVYQGSGE